MTDPEFSRPAGLAEAAETLAEHGESAMVLGGGTALIPLLKKRLSTPRVLVGLHRIPGISGVNRDHIGVHIGAQATLRTLETAPPVVDLIPGLAEAVAQIGILRIRNQATVGGTLACGDPRLDLPALLAALDAEIHLTSIHGQRTVAIADFYPGDRDRATSARPEEFITGVRVPVPPPGSALTYLRYLPGSAVGYPTVSVAARLALDEAGERMTDVRLALAGAGSTTTIARAAQERLRGQPPIEAAFAHAASEVQAAIAPESDSRGTAEYKRSMAAVFVRRALTRALDRLRHDTPST